MCLFLKQKQEEIREKRFGSRQNKTFTLDFAGRKVIDEKKEVNMQAYAQEIETILNSENIMNSTQQLQANVVANQSITIVPQVEHNK